MPDRPPRFRSCQEGHVPHLSTIRLARQRAASAEEESRLLREVADDDASVQARERANPAGGGAALPAERDEQAPERITAGDRVVLVRRIEPRHPRREPELP